MKCKWCASAKHKSANCRIRRKLGLLNEILAVSDSITLEQAASQAGFIVLDCANVEEVADKVDAVHTLLT